VPYALWNLEDRGELFIGAGTPVYPGMIIGEHARGTDLEVNPLKAKQLTNIRASGKDEAVRLTAGRGDAGRGAPQETRARSACAQAAEPAEGCQLRVCPPTARSGVGARLFRSTCIRASS
jgi:hypothetical protein